MADQKESNTTTSASVKEFISWVANDWQTQTASEAAKTVFGTGTLWVGASGNAGANVLNASNKTTEVLLDGGAGNDTLLGGLGDDILVVLDNSQLNLSFAIKTVAARADDMSARSRFDPQIRRYAVNDEYWWVVA